MTRIIELGLEEGCKERDTRDSVMYFAGKALREKAIAGLAIGASSNTGSALNANGR